MTVSPDDRDALRHQLGDTDPDYFTTGILASEVLGLLDALILAEEQRDAALRAFARYGQHDRDCRLSSVIERRRGFEPVIVGCSCGFSDALDARPSGGVPAAAPEPEEWHGNEIDSVRDAWHGGETPS